MKFKSLMILLGMFFCLTANYGCVSTDAERISKELKNMETVFPLPYHDDLVKFVDEYKKKDLPDLFCEYEGFIENELQSRNIPLELKYLPIALTEMQQDYSCNDRCGVWALPTLVGLHYGLTIDQVHDERFSIEASTKVALDYLSELHDKYDDWWYCILAFSNSPSSVQHAISQNDQPLEVWDFYEQHLVLNPDVVCNFIASVFVYHEHQSTDSLKNENLGTIDFSNPISISLLAHEIQLPKETIRLMNPVFRSDIMVPMEGYSLVLPNEYVERFQMIEQKLYDETAAGVVVNIEDEKPVEKEVVSQPKNEIPKNTIKYKVKKGNTLSHIAQKYHVTVSELMEWNHLESDFIRDGQELIIIRK